MISPLRYPGGKAKLFPFFSQLVCENGFYSKTYCEPYAGGAGLALKLLGHGFISRFELNDIDPALIAFWRSVLYDTDRFCELVDQVSVTVDEWRRQRDVYREGIAAGTLSLGFAAYFLNRTSRSGIIEGSGPIGGYEQRSEWKIDARLNKTSQISNIRSAAKLEPYISVTQMDALDFLRERLDDDERLIYLDPPYYVKGRKLYKSFYRHGDHVEISRLLNSNRGSNWIISYDYVPEVVSIYDGYKPMSYNLQYSAGQPAMGKEVIFVSDTVKLPNLEGFGIAA